MSTSNKLISFSSRRKSVMFVAVNELLVYVFFRFQSYKTCSPGPAHTKRRWDLDETLKKCTHLFGNQEKKTLADIRWPYTQQNTELNCFCLWFLQLLYLSLTEIVLINIFNFWQLHPKLFAAHVSSNVDTFFCSVFGYTVYEVTPITLNIFINYCEVLISILDSVCTAKTT